MYQESTLWLSKRMKQVQEVLLSASILDCFESRHVTLDFPTGGI